MAKDIGKKKAKDKLKAIRKEMKAAAKSKRPQASPLAPAAFPDLPVIAGVSFASGSAGIKYKGRTDVTLMQVAAGSAVAFMGRSPWGFSR